MKDIAKLANVAPGTVSRALRNDRRIGAARRQQIQEIAANLGYKPNRIARALVTGSTQIIGLAVTDIANPHYSRIVEGVESVLRAHGYSVLLFNTAEDPQRERELVQVANGLFLAGLILTPVLADAELGEQLAQISIPVVLVNRYRPFQSDNVVMSDNEMAGLLAITHLLDHGHRDIALCGGRRSSSAWQSRVLGAQKAMAARSAALDDGLVGYGSPVLDTGYEFVKDLMTRRVHFTGIYASNDLLALGCLKALEEAGIRVPDQVSLISSDDSYMADLPYIHLTAIRQPQRQLGEEAARIMLHLLSSQEQLTPRRVVLPVQLVPRRSTGPAPAGPQGEAPSRNDVARGRRRSK